MPHGWKNRSFLVNLNDVGPEGGLAAGTHKRLEVTQLALLERVAHTTMLGLSHPGAIELAQRLVDLAPPGLSRVFYSDSGSTATEIALKMAFQYWQQQGGEGARKTRFVSLRHAYHGDTVGSLSLGADDGFGASLFSPLRFPVLRAPGRNADGVAELAVGMLLAVTRHVLTADHDMRAGEVYRDGSIPYQRFRAWQVAGRTVGEGFGRIRAPGKERVSVRPSAGTRAKARQETLWGEWSETVEFRVAKPAAPSDAAFESTGGGGVPGHNPLLHHARRAQLLVELAPAGHLGVELGRALLRAGTLGEREKEQVLHGRPDGRQGIADLMRQCRGEFADRSQGLPL